MKTNCLRNTTALAIVGAYLLALGQPSPTFGFAGTSQVVSAGSEVQQEPGWPQGVAVFLNQPARTNGWNDFFSEWPNDVNQYELHPRTIDDVNALIARFSRIESDNLQLILTPVTEPRGYGWVSSFAEGNSIPMMFTIGNQQRLDQWFDHLHDGQLGNMQFERPPVAVPPSLTLFVGNEIVEMQKLDIPDNITVRADCLPRLWHKSNLKPVDPPAEAKKLPREARPIDPTVQSRADAIEAFIKSRAKAADNDR